MYRRLSGSGVSLPLASVEEGDESRNGAQQSPAALPLPPADGSSAGRHAPLRSDTRQSR